MKKTRILVPPGIGDVYWVLVKLKSFIETNNLYPPELTIVSYPDDMNAHLRSIPFLEMVDGISIGEPKSIANASGLDDLWNEAYYGPGRSIFHGTMGYDFFIAYNGCINSGWMLEDADGYACDWTGPLRNIQIESPMCGIPSAKILLCFFPFVGTYLSHERDFPVHMIAESINRIALLYDLTPVFIGGKTEQVHDVLRDGLVRAVPGSIDLVGGTLLAETFGLLRDCRMIFGYHSGIPNLGVAMKKPAVLLWDARFPEGTSYACVPPDTRQITYHAVPTKGLTVDTLMPYLENACAVI